MTAFGCTCPHCKARYAKVPEDAAGKTMRCRGCGKTFEVVLGPYM